MSSIASSNSQVDHRPAAFQIYRDFKECEDVWDDVNPTVYWGNDHELAVPPPPLIILVQGPPKVGKSLLIRSLVNHFNMEEDYNDIQGSITIMTADRRTRLQFVECPDDINAMIDAAKYADLVLLLVDANYGFEAETFEFLNLLQVHGLPKVMGVLTHLDEFEDETKLNETKERLQDLFQTEIYQGAITYSLSGLQHDLYNMRDVQELALQISKHQFYLSSRRAAHPYVLVDRFKDVTPPKKVQRNVNCKRNIRLYGYLRGCYIKSGDKVHVAGLGDFHLADVRSTTDPFPVSSETEEENEFVGVIHMGNEYFRTGTYIRLEIHDVPFRMVQNLVPCHPILVGGISPEEEDVGYMQARLKRHNWHMKLLKSGDSVTVSVGWRRYQTKPIYARKINNGRHQILEFNPEAEHCLAMFWGPVAPPCTKIAVVQRNKDVFRIAAKAVVLDPKHHSRILKESKREGKPHKVRNGRTAFIQFDSDVDIAKFKGAPIRTCSGIWGKVNEGVNGEGIARCTFEESIHMSDSFIMRVLCQAEAPRFLKPCSSTVPVNKDSLEKKRRGVQIIDGEPSSYPYSKFTLFFNIMFMSDKDKETVVVMSEEKRLEMLKRHQEEYEEPCEDDLIPVDS